MKKYTAIRNLLFLRLVLHGANADYLRYNFNANGIAFFAINKFAILIQINRN